LYLNETLHPKAESLFATIIEGPDSYEGLETWRKLEGYYDEKAADLYARIEDSFDAKPINSLTKPQAVSMLSRSLWANDKVFRV
jgi:hypothetical protein